MSKSFKHFVDGEHVATYNEERRKQTLKEKIERAKRARKDARLAWILTK